jgi:hypothetical protein
MHIDCFLAAAPLGGGAPTAALHSFLAAAPPLPSAHAWRRVRVPRLQVLEVRSAAELRGLCSLEGWLDRLGCSADEKAAALRRGL